MPVGTVQRRLIARSPKSHRNKWLYHCSSTLTSVRFSFILNATLNFIKIHNDLTLFLFLVKNLWSSKHTACHSITILFYFSENPDCLHHVVHERLGELLRILKAIISKHPSLNSVDLLSAAGTVIAKVKGEGMGWEPLRLVLDMNCK